jgi:hypothetical protein
MVKKFITFYETQKFRHHVHISQPLVLSQINPFHDLWSYFFEIHFNFICPSMCRSSKSSLSFSSVHQDPVCTSLLTQPCHMPCPYHPWFYNLKICSEYYILGSSLCKLLQPPSTFSASGPNIFLSILFSNTFILCSPLMCGTKFHTHVKQQTKSSMYFNHYVLGNQCGLKILHYQCFYWMFSLMVVVDLWVHMNTVETDKSLVGQ